MSTSDVLTPQVTHFKTKSVSQKKFGKIRFGRFRSNKKKFSSNQTKNSTKQKRSTTKIKTKTKTNTKAKQGKFKQALRRKLKNRTRKEKSAITALIVLSSNKTQKENQDTNSKNQKKTQDQSQEQNRPINTKRINVFPQTKEPYPNLTTVQGQGQGQEQEQEQKVKEQDIDLNRLRSLYIKYEKPTIIKKNTHEPSVQQPFSGYKSTILTHVEMPISEDTTSTNDQLEGQSYDDSFSEDVVSFSDEESEMVSVNTPSHLNHMNEIHSDEGQYYTISDEEMESIGDEITISFGKIDNLTNTHRLISPQNYCFASESFGKTSSYPKHLLCCDYSHTYSDNGVVRHN
ncbi:hypothetical protein M0812_27332 [Anaeramoeba flamelloides]|uniref:Uncharacterized protein n=1 Tax=Anaeramoeba flamelloides TaxID=1746091 RepID=A0AAV7Y5Z6_9EUKA|nr:hypothetical protein M0812_27332 [Anaeramoeba flamelloides]